MCVTSENLRSPVFFLTEAGNRIFDRKRPVAAIVVQLMFCSLMRVITKYHSAGEHVNANL